MPCSAQMIKLQKLINKNKIISFDVFDTLLFRTIRKPVDLFSFMEMLQPELFTIFEGAFKSIRINAEHVARNHTIENEASLDDIYFYIKYIYPLTDDVIEKIKAVELQAERMLCYANPLATKIFNYAIQQNKKIIICSDMYLPASFICELLSINHFNITNNITIYVSNEHKANKHTGAIFSKILLENAINPKTMLHIGDNYLSDIKNAKRHKINTYYLKYPHKLLSQQSISNQNNDITSSLIAGLKLKFILNSDRLNMLEKVCINRIAAFHLAYFLFIIKKINQSASEKVLFFSRDSYIYYRLVDKFKHKFNWHKKYSYFYVSRKSIQNETLFSEYIKQECEGLSHIALVDVGWRGTVHSKIETLGAFFEKKIDFHGCYINLVLTDKTKNICHFDSFLVNFPQKTPHLILAEVFHIAPHTTTLNYEKKENMVIPIFEQSVAEEQKLIDSGMKIQNASLAFISMVLNDLPADILFRLNLKKLTEPFFDMVESPSFADVTTLGDLTFSARAGRTDKERKKISPKIFMGFLGNLNPLYKKAKRDIAWKEGTKKRNFVLNLKK